jgi:hypothetical protein
MWARAEAAYLRHPDEDADEMDTCQSCEKGKVPNPDYDPSEQDPKMMEDKFHDCEECYGSGEINLTAIKRREHQDAKDYADECKFQQQRDKR